MANKNRRECVKKKISERIRVSKEVPRACVFRTNSAVYCQVISIDGRVLAVCSSHILKKKENLNNEVKEGRNKKCKKESCNIDWAFKVGVKIAKKVKELGYDKVCFDRNGFLYHGKIKAISDGIKEGGIKI